MTAARSFYDCFASIATQRPEIGGGGTDGPAAAGELPAVGDCFSHDAYTTP
jgi:hypothetical protein